MKNNFYCEKKCGGSGYKNAHIKEALSDCEGMNLSPEEIKQVTKEVHMSFIETCTVQCNYCANIVKETQSKNKAIRELVSSTQKH